VRRSWKDDLPPIIIATAVQFGVLRAVDWAKAAAETNENARKLVENHFYYAPQVIAVVIALLLVKMVRDHLDVRGVDAGDWLRRSALVIFVGVGIMLAAHLDQVFRLLSFTGVSAFKQTADAFAKNAVYDLLRAYSIVRWGIDIVGLLVCFLALRIAAPDAPERVTAKDISRSGNWARAGELYQKTGDYRHAKAAFKKANQPARIATIELREGHPREAARLFEEAGPAFAWEAAHAWSQAGDESKAADARKAALVEARSSARWDRLAEIGDATGDPAAVAEACRRLAELAEPGPVRTGLWRRSADAAKAAGSPGEAGEAYRASGEFQLAAEAFLAAGKPRDAAQDFERAGDLAHAALAAAKAGMDKESRAFLARDAELRGDIVAAAEAWQAAGNVERAAGLFEKKGLLPRAAELWKNAGRVDRAAQLYERSGDLLGAAASWEAAGQRERAAALYRKVGDNERAAALFRGAGKWIDSAAALEAGGRYEEAAVMYAKADAGFDAARCALLAGHRDQAWEHLVGVPRNEPKTKEFFVKLAEAHLAAGEARDAVHVLRELLGPTPVTKETVAAQYLYARALAMAGETAEASDRISRITDVDPAYVAARESRSPLGAAETRRMPSAPITTGTYGAPATHVASMPAPAVASPPRERTYSAHGVVIPGSGGGAPAASSYAVPQTPQPPGAFTRSTGVYGVPTPSVESSGGFPAMAETPESRYEIVSELGRGGMGVVHKALDRKLDRYVALKILPWQSLGDEMALRYFSREARVIAQLKHPNIVGLYDYGRGWGSLYLAMEYLEGPNLQVMMKSDPARLKKSWRGYFVQAARGVAAAHTKGLLHRDIKPANLMLDEHGILRILDFGLARPESDSGATSKLIGTPAFFPPEVLRGETPTPAADVYSLGATFYTLATGRWPYIGDDVLVARLEREPDDPHPYAPHLSEVEIEVLMKALARHRPERYPDAGELLGALLSLEG
jgi:tetratricopeptide (TPR) repeat protein